MVQALTHLDDFAPRTESIYDLGCWITIGAAPIWVTALGRKKRPDNTLPVTVHIVDKATEIVVSGASASIDPTGVTDYDYAWTSLATPVMLPASGEYYLMALEYTGESWNDAQPPTSIAADIAVTQAAYVAFSVYNLGSSGNQWANANFEYSLTDPGAGGGSPSRLLLLGVG